MSSITAKQIDVLVRDWPEAARKGYQHYSASAQDATYTDKLYWEMVGRGLGWLAERVKGSAVVVDFYKTDPAYVIRTLDSCVPALSNEDTLLAAVSSAVLAAAKEGA